MPLESSCFRAQSPRLRSQWLMRLSTLCFQDLQFHWKGRLSQKHNAIQLATYQQAFWTWKSPAEFGMKLVGGCRMPVHGFMPQLVIGCQIVGTCCLIVRVAFPYQISFLAGNSLSWSARVHSCRVDRTNSARNHGFSNEILRFLMIPANFPFNQSGTSLGIEIETGSCSSGLRSSPCCSLPDGFLHFAEGLCLDRHAVQAL